MDKPEAKVTIRLKMGPLHEKHQTVYKAEADKYRVSLEAPDGTWHIYRHVEGDSWYWAGPDPERPPRTKTP